MEEGKKTRVKWLNGSFVDDRKRQDSLGTLRPPSTINAIMTDILTVYGNYSLFNTILYLSITTLESRTTKTLKELTMTMTKSSLPSL